MALIAWYKLDGNANDTLGVFNGTPSNMTYTTGKFSQAGSFNGTSSGITCDINIAIKSFSMWVYVTAIPTDSRILFIDASSYVGFGFYNNSQFILTSNSNTQRTALFTGFNTNVWNHIVVTYSATSVPTLYINGIEAIYSGYSNYWTETSGTYIGRRSSGSYFNGLIDDLKIYDHALSAKEVKLLSQAKILHYKFDDPNEEPAVNLNYNPSANDWINSGTWTRNGNETDIAKPFPGNLSIWSGLVLTTGSIHFGFSYTSASPSTKYTISIWYRQNRAGASSPYMRSVANNNNISNFSYGGTTNSSLWPVNTWIRIACTATTASNETSIYLSNYIGGQVGDKIWYYAYQVEQKDHASAYVYGTRIGKAIDSSEYGNHGTINLVNSPAISSTSKIGQYSSEFTATSQYIQIPWGQGIDPTLNTLTISIWIKSSSPSSNQMFFTTSQVPNSAARFYLAHYGGYWDMGIQSSSWGSGTSFTSTSDWTHYAIVFNGSNAIMYINGVQHISKAYTSYTFNANAVIGIHDGNYQWLGNIDDVRVYSTALSLDDLIEIYQSRASLDKNGNFYISELDVNGIGDLTNVVPYQNIISGTYTTAQSFYNLKSGTDYEKNRMSYATAPEYNVVIGNYPNPWGILDKMVKINILTTHYVQYRNLGVNYYFTFDQTKTYRITQWVYTGRVAGTSDSQNNYFGIYPSNIVCNLNTTTANSNPYFTAPAMNYSGTMNKWALYVYYIYPYGSTGNPSNVQGLYYPDGTFSNTGSNYNWNTGSTNAYIRQYIMYQYGEIASGSYVSLYRPRIEVIDGTEEPLNNLKYGFEHRSLIDSSGNDIEITITNKSIGFFTEIDEVSGTSSSQQAQLLSNGTLIINGEFSEVD